MRPTHTENDTSKMFHPSVSNVINEIKVPTSMLWAHSCAPLACCTVWQSAGLNSAVECNINIAVHQKY